jgi:hypothetical protein
MTTSTYTITYTVTDIRRVAASFAADYHMIAQATGLLTTSYVEDTVHDVKVLAEAEYLSRADIVLLDASGRVVRAAKYTTSTDASHWKTDRPGDNLWPRVSNSALSVVVSYSQKWKDEMGDPQRWAAFRKEYLRISWVPADVDLSYPGLFGQTDRHYVSNAYGMERTSYR